MTKGREQTNPLREGLATRAVPQACTVVIFGATGDLTMRKLIPALYNIAADGELPPALTVVGFARRPKTDEEFRKEQEEATGNFRARRCATKSGTTSPNPFSIIRASSTMRRATKRWRSASTRLIGNAAPAGIGFFISRSRRTSSSRS